MSLKVSSLAVNIARILCAVALLSSALVWASVGGSIAGTVKDPSGRVIPNAEITLRESTTGISYQAHSDAPAFFQDLRRNALAVIADTQAKQALIVENLGMNVTRLCMQKGIA